MTLLRRALFFVALVVVWHLLAERHVWDATLFPSPLTVADPISGPRRRGCRWVFPDRSAGTLPPNCRALPVLYQAWIAIGTSVAKLPARITEVLLHLVRWPESPDSLCLG